MRRICEQKSKQCEAIKKRLARPLKKLEEIISNENANVPESGRSNGKDLIQKVTMFKSKVQGHMMDAAKTDLGKSAQGLAEAFEADLKDAVDNITAMSKKFGKVMSW